MKRIITVQHPQSEHHVNGMVGSWTDWLLTELGRRQAAHIGEKLKDEMQGKAVLLYSSDLLRARQTAEIIGGCLGVAPILRAELRERNLGRCCGKSVQWLRENIECPERTVDDRLFSDAESRRDVWNRLRPFMDELLSDDHEYALIVSHGDLLGVFAMMFLGLPVESLNVGGLYGCAGGVSELLVNREGKHILKRFGDRAYL